MRKPITPDERRQIIDCLKAGVSGLEVARKFDRFPAQVYRIAREAGVPMYRGRPSSLSSAQEKVVVLPSRSEQNRRPVEFVEFTKDERIKLLNEAFNKAREILQNISDPRSFALLVGALGILIDRMRLEIGESTDRTEIMQTARETLQHKLDELAARRKRQEQSQDGSRGEAEVS